MKLLSDKIIQPLLSEKSSLMNEKLNEYAVLIDAKMTKTEVKKAVESLFGVKPLSVRTVVFRKKTRRTRYGVVPTKTFKKALIRLPEGQRIELK